MYHNGTFGCEAGCRVTGYGYSGDRVSTIWKSMETIWKSMETIWKSMETIWKQYGSVWEHYGSVWQDMVLFFINLYRLSMDIHLIDIVFDG